MTSEDVDLIDSRQNFNRLFVYFLSSANIGISVLSFFMAKMGASSFGSSNDVYDFGKNSFIVFLSVVIFLKINAIFHNNLLIKLIIKESIHFIKFIISLLIIRIILFFKLEGFGLFLGIFFLYWSLVPLLPFFLIYATEHNFSKKSLISGLSAMLLFICPFATWYLWRGYHNIHTLSFNTDDGSPFDISFELYAFAITLYAVAFLAALAVFWLIYPKIQPFANWLHTGFSGKVMRVLQVMSAMLGLPVLILFFIFA